jgi:hypothetical protein
MIMTNSERQWLTRVMDTINHVTIMVPSNALDRPVQNGAGEDVLRAAQNFIEVLRRGHQEAVNYPDADLEMRGRGSF